MGRIIPYTMEKNVPNHQPVNILKHIQTMMLTLHQYIYIYVLLKYIQTTVYVHIYLNNYAQIKYNNIENVHAYIIYI